jgi:hypothetical protein
MALLNGYASPRTPLRVETTSGTLVTLATTDAEGWWSVAVDPGEYVINERHGGSWRATATEETEVASADAAAEITTTATASPSAVTSSWVTRHGDTSRSDIWAVLDAEGDPLFLSTWEVLAQARDTPTSDVVVYEWTKDHGVTIGSATVRLPDDSEVTTSTIRLYLDPNDYEYLPRVWSGVFDVEITLKDVDGTPLRRYTVVEEGKLTILPDVTR